jgi:glycosyltransferase involved in cell wall biosynthesis
MPSKRRGWVEQELRVALVHDFWVHLRGGERLFLGLSRLFPKADCYTLVCRTKGLPPEMAELPVRTSALSQLPGSARYFRALLPLYPLAARSLDLQAYDLVISSSSGFCHRVRTRGAHVCYCHAPLRYAWNMYEHTLAQQRSVLVRSALRSVLRRMRQADYQAAQRVTQYVANSTTVQQRIAQYYHRDSIVVHPFVDSSRFQPGASTGEYYLVVSQLHSYKRVDLAVQACTALHVPLVVVGEGPERAQLERLAGPTVRFAGRVSDADLPDLYRQSLAFLQCGEEDFGIAALEAQSCGIPVIAFSAGGARETVIHGVSGFCFTEPTVPAVIDAIQHTQRIQWDPTMVRASAERYDEAHFRAKMTGVVAEAMSVHSRRAAMA